MKNYKKILMVSVLLLPMLSGCGNGDMKVKKEEVVIRYGKPYSTNPATYVEADKKVLKKAKVVVKDPKWPKAEIGGNSIFKRDHILEAGDYTLEVKYKDEIDEIKLKVEDKDKPKFPTSDISISKGSNEKQLIDEIKSETFNVNSGEYFSRKALKVKLKGHVDYNKVGKYDVKVSIIDQSGNETKKNLTVEVKESVKQIICTKVDDDPELGLSQTLIFNFDKEQKLVSGEFQVKAAAGKKFYEVSDADYKQICNEAAQEDDKSLFDTSKSHVARNPKEMIYTAPFRMEEQVMLDTPETVQLSAKHNGFSVQVINY